MAKKVCAICKQKLGAFKKKIPYADRVICSSCAKTAKCLVCNKELCYAKAEVLFNDGYFCPECMKKTGITSFLNPKSRTAEFMSKFIESRTSLAEAYIPTKRIEENFSVDEIHKAFKIGDDIFEYKNLLSFELMQDNQYVIKGGVGRALLFAAALGILGLLWDFGLCIAAALTGLIVGSVTASKKTKGICNWMKLKITLKDAHVDAVYIPIITSKMGFDSSVYQALLELAQAHVSALEIIAEYNRAQNSVKKGYDAPSEADEILKFKQLMDEGIITNGEFEAKKKQILNLPVEAKDESEAEQPEETESIGN